MLAIKEARKRAGLSQEELAKKTGITQAFLSEIETQTKCPSLGTAIKLARALGCTVDELIGEDEQNSH